MTSRRKSWWPPVAAAALAILVALLAVLQYRWTGEISRAEQERMQGGLDAAARRFADDFDREINRAFHFFRVAPSTDPVTQFASRMDSWQRSSPAPGIVGEILLVTFPPPLGGARRDGAPPPGEPRGEDNRRPDFRRPETRPPLMREPETRPGEPPGVGLFRLDRARNAMVPAEWPPDLENWRAQFEPGQQPPNGERPESRLELIDPRIPALAIPFSAGPSGFMENRRPEPGGVVIVRLDRNYIASSWIPELVWRHFPSSSGDHYSVAIRGLEGEQIVSAPGREGRPARPDVEVGIFSLRPFPELAGMMPERGTGPGMFSGGPRGSGRAERMGMEPGRGGEGTGPGLWTVELRREGGTLDAVIARNRTRNLALSGIVLTLLAVSAALLVVAACRAERLAAQQMELVAGVTHELNTPIAALCAAGQNLADGVVTGEPQIRKYGEMISREGRRLSSMVAQMLQFAGIQSGERAVQRTRTRLEPIIDAAIADLAWLLDEASVQVETNVAGGLPDVDADPDALARAIANLVSNAVKYRGSSSVVRVMAARDSRPGWLRIGVEDHGIGIDPSDLASVFEPFYRGRSPAVASVRGSGLGLSIVRQVVREHGGTVDVISTAGKGSTFTIRLPAHGTARGGR